MKKIIPVLFLAGAFLLEGAEESNWNKPDGWILPEKASAKEGILVIPGKFEMLRKDFIDIDPEKTCTLTVSCRSADGKASSCMPFLIQYDAKGRKITTANVKTIGGTFTELLAPLKAGDRTIRVRDAKYWPKKRPLVVAFHAEKDYSDLPNYTLAWNTIASIEEKDGAYGISFRNPIPFSVQGGGVRLHENGGMMFPLGGRNTTAAWQKMQGSIRGRERNSFSHNVWAPGAVKAKIGIMVNWNDPDAVTELKEIALTVQ